MRRTFAFAPALISAFLLVLAPSAAFGAAKAKPAPKPASKAAAKTATKAKPAPKPGKATKADLEAAQALVKPFQPWDESLKKVVERIGPPTKIDGAKHLWYAKDGDKCIELEIDKMDTSVGTNSVLEYDKATKKDLYAKCDALK